MEPTFETIAQTWPLWLAFVALQLVLRAIDSRKNAERAQTLINSTYTKQEARIDTLTRELSLATVRAKESDAIAHEMATRLNALSEELDCERKAREAQAAEVKSLKAQVATLEAAVKAHDKDKQTAEAERDAATKKNTELEAALGAAQARIGELEKRVQHLEALVEAKDKALELVAGKISEAIERAVKPAAIPDGAGQTTEVTA